MMDQDLLLARTEGKHTGQVALAVPVKTVVGLVVEDEDEPLFLLFVRKPAFADDGPV